tara:strand:+ start:80238 stop:80828 length:591 start_codon:yes stop_codon:yes gene_type:complete
MKQKRHFSLLILCLLFIGSSCSLEKRQHRTGYHLKLRSSHSQPLVKKSLIPTKEISLTPLNFVLTERHAFPELKPPTKPTRVLSVVRQKAHYKTSSQKEYRQSPILAPNIKEKEKGKREAKETDPEQKTDPWAIIGLVLGLIPTVSLLGVIIGFFSLNRIKKNPKLKGQELAKGGIIAGSIYTLIILAILLSTYRE